MLTDPHTWSKLLEAVHEMNSAQTHADFGSSVLVGLTRLVSADMALFQAFDRTTRRIFMRSQPADCFTEAEVAYYLAHSEEMPLVAYYARTADTNARRISDVIEESAWRSSAYYLNCHTRLAIPYTLALPIKINTSTVAAISFNRCVSDFTLRDCELLDAFAPHFRLAWNRHEDPWAESGELAVRRRLRHLGLSPRESEVLYWMTEGKQNREIATILGLQLGTVQEYVGAIRAKLGQENRHAATVFAIGKLRER